MQVFTSEFIASVKSKLESIQDGFYMTREQLCISLNIAPAYANSITMLLSQPEFSNFEAVKSRGIRRKKNLATAA
jgi:hypothetical protein